MPSRGRKCPKIYYSRLEDWALTKELVDFFGSSPRAKNLLKRVVNQVTELSPLLHCSMPRVGGAPSKFLLNVRWNGFWTFKFQRKGVPWTRACNFKIATKIAFHPKLHSC